MTSLQAATDDNLHMGKCGRSFLSRRVEDVMADREVVEITTHASFKEIVSLLSKEEISAVPVYSEEERKYVGFIEIKDIVEQLADASAISNTSASVDEINASIESYLRAMRDTNKQEEELITRMAKANGFHPVPLGSSVLDVVVLMKQDVARVPVLGKDGRIVKIVSQSDVIQYLAVHADALDSKVTHATLRDLKLGFKSVNVISSHEHTYSAIRYMARCRLAEIPLVRDTRTDCESNGTFSFSNTFNEKDVLAAASMFIRDDYNLRNTDGLFSFFAMRAEDFVHAVRCNSLARHKAHFFAAGVTIRPTEQLWFVIHKLAATRIHRLYLCENLDYTLECPDASGILGVVSLVDVIKALL